MVDWHSPDEIQKDGGMEKYLTRLRESSLALAYHKLVAEVFAKFMHTLLGLYMYVVRLENHWQCN